MTCNTKKMYMQIYLVSRLTHTMASLETKQEEVLDTGNLCLLDR